MRSKWLIPGIIVGVIVLAVVTLMGTYNGLVGQREKVTASFANVQTQYQRRADLIPNLVNTVKGSANFEQSTLTQVVEARSKATSIQVDPSKATPEQVAKYEEAQGQVGSALGRLIAVAENYPDLKASAAFQDLMSQLEGTENRIQVARSDFNEVARPYNTRLQTFPTNLVAGMFGFEQRGYFQADAGTDTAPKVDFGTSNQ
jgi:LemA protein